MSTTQSNNYSIAIIGAGLVGGAILHEIVFGWVRAHGGGSSLGHPSKVSSAEHLGVDTIFITATDEPGLAAQLQKLKAVLGALPDISVSHQRPLFLTLHCGSNSLHIEAERLNILPEGPYYSQCRR